MWHPSPNLTFAPVSYLPIFQKSWRHWQDTFHENDLWLADLQKGLNLVSDGDRTAFWGPDPRSSFLSKFFKMNWIIRFKKKNWLTRGRYLIYCYDMVWQWFFSFLYLHSRKNLQQQKKKCYFFHTFPSIFWDQNSWFSLSLNYHFSLIKLRIMVDESNLRLTECHQKKKTNQKKKKKANTWVKLKLTNWHLRTANTWAKLQLMKSGVKKCHIEFNRCYNAPVYYKAHR